MALVQSQLLLIPVLGQELGRDFQVLAVSVLLLPWLQTSPIILLWSSWIPAQCSSSLQSLTESYPSKTEAVGGGFHHFCSKLHLGVLLCYSDFFTLPYLEMSGPFKSPVKNLFTAFLSDLCLFSPSNPIPQYIPLLWLWNQIYQQPSHTDGIRCFSFPSLFRQRLEYQT